MENANGSFEAIRDHYFSLDVSFNSLFNACVDDSQKNQLRRDYVNSRDAFWEARNRAFTNDDPLVIDIVKRLDATTDQLTMSLNDLQDIVKVLGVVDAGTSFASRLIALGARDGA